MSAYTVSRSVFIPAPPEQVFPYVNSFRKWSEWSPWETVDPSLERTYSGPEAGVGAQYAWVGNRKVGSGRMEIVESIEPRLIRIRLEFLKPIPGVNPTTFTFEPLADGTHVTWAMASDPQGIMKFFARFMNLDKVVGKDYERGLARLSAVSAPNV